MLNFKIVYEWDLIHKSYIKTNKLIEDKKKYPLRGTFKLILNVEIDAMTYNKVVIFSKCL